MGEGKSALISDGEADVLLGFEPVETLRALVKCHTRALVITNLSPLPPFTVAIGKGQYPDLTLIQDLIRQKTGMLFAFDGLALARQAGSRMSLNMVMMGALFQSNVLPLSEGDIRHTIRTASKPGSEAINLRAFELGLRTTGLKQM